MLESSQHDKLLTLLSAENKRFEDSLHEFERCFHKAEYFRVLWTVQHLLQQNVPAAAPVDAQRGPATCGSLHTLRDLSA
jgi:hypothetical protein